MKHANIAIFVPHTGCPNRCSFCDQKTISGTVHEPDAAEVGRICGEAFGRPGGCAGATEIAFFGGSFTALPEEQMVGLLEAAYEWVRRGACMGIRVSTRPDRVDPAVLRVLRRYGVTAVELGAQSMDDAVLSRNGRGHTAREVETASRLIRAEGLELGHQMMLGLPGDSDAGAWETARRLAELEPDTMRIYPTVVLDGTRLGRWYREGLYQPPALEESVRLAAGLLAFFESRSIRVIRLGLHASGDVEARMLAGGYHPALRELCEARLYLEGFLARLEEEKIPPGRVEIAVAPGCISKAAGQKRRNLLTLEERGYRARIVEDIHLTGREFCLKEVSFCT